jgi:hypothetical protein
MDLLDYSGQRTRNYTATLQNKKLFKLRQRGEKRIGRGIVAEGLADVGKAIHIAGAEYKATTKLKRILAQLVLMMTGCLRAFAARGVITTKKMQKICRAESGGTVGAAFLVDQQGKRDAGFLAEDARIITISQSDGGQVGSLVSEGLLAFAQLRDVLAAENSSIVPKEDDYGRRQGPKRAESNFAAVGIGEHDLRQFAAKRLLHDGSILVMAAFAVKRR